MALTHRQERWQAGQDTLAHTMQTLAQGAVLRRELKNTKEPGQVNNNIENLMNQIGLQIQRDGG